MKPRTLKDLMVYGSGFTFSGEKSKRFPYPMFREVDLRTEAIKWVKKCKCKFRCGACMRFIRFFNITQEELRNMKGSGKE